VVCHLPQKLDKQRVVKPPRHILIGHVKLINIQFLLELDRRYINFTKIGLWKLTINDMIINHDMINKINKY